MFRLETLGGLALTDGTAAVVTAQRRRLALLTLLAVGGERGLTRDKLVAYLWPESPSDNARHALEQLLYALRRQLGDSALLGPDPLRLNPEIITSDVAEFGQAIGRGAPAEAVGLYRGPFLDGFYLSEAAEFERWADRERSRLAEAHGRALRLLAKEAETRGQHTAEIEYRRQLAAADPLEERAAADLVRALAAADDWAGALLVAGEYRARMREELPGAASADLEGLVQQLRDARRPSTPGEADGRKGRYAIERELGSGTAATVYLARDRQFDRPVALKLLRPEVANATDARRFRREMAILARLHHPHILQLFDAGYLSGEGGLSGPYYIMAYVRGESLRQQLEREGRLPLDVAVSIVRDVAEALDHAHGLGVVHRDIRPENLLLEAGHALVADFGIASVLESAGGERLSASGVVLGVAEYTSPEQARGGRSLDGRSDIYSLGCVLYEMLGAAPPFRAATRAATLARQISDPPPRLRALCPEVPAGIERVVLRALAKRPEERFSMAGQFAQALTRG